MELPHILTNNSLTIILDGKTLTMERSNPSYSKADELLKKKSEKIEKINPRTKNVKPNPKRI